MQNKLYVGNLPYTVTDEDLSQMFSEHGAVQSAKVIMDRERGRSKGFGFVEMEDEGQAQSAIEAMNGQAIDGRNLTVNIAKPREEGGGRSGGGGGRRGGGGGGGFDRGQRNRW